MTSTVTEIVQDMEEKEAHILHARYELGVLSSRVYDLLPGKADLHARTVLLQSIETIDIALRAALA